jgi:archaellum component FlaC
MDGDGKFDHIQREFAEFVDQFARMNDQAESSENLIASAEYELERLKQDFKNARLPSLR